MLFQISEGFAGKLACVLGIIKSFIGQRPIGHPSFLAVFAGVGPTGAAEVFEFWDEIACALEVDFAVGVNDGEDRAFRVEAQPAHHFAGAQRGEVGEEFFREGDIFV